MSCLFFLNLSAIQLTSDATHREEVNFREIKKKTGHVMHLDAIFALLLSRGGILVLSWAVVGEPVHHDDPLS